MIRPVLLSNPVCGIQVPLAHQHRRDSFGSPAGRCSWAANILRFTSSLSSFCLINTWINNSVKCNNFINTSKTAITNVPFSLLVWIGYLAWLLTALCCADGLAAERVCHCAAAHSFFSGDARCATGLVCQRDSESEVNLALVHNCTIIYIIWESNIRGVFFQSCFVLDCFVCPFTGTYVILRIVLFYVYAYLFR